VNDSDKEKGSTIKKAWQQQGERSKKSRQRS